MHRDRIETKCYPSREGFRKSKAYYQIFLNCYRCSQREDYLLTKPTFITIFTYHMLSVCHNGHGALNQKANCTIIVSKLDLNQIQEKSYSVVGPVCESADFVNKDALLPRQIKADDLVALWDAGAYCHVMGSHYNMRPKRAEILVKGAKMTLIRKAETIEDILEKTCISEI